MRLHRGLRPWGGRDESEQRSYVPCPVPSAACSRSAPDPLPRLLTGREQQRIYANSRATGTPDRCHWASNVTPIGHELASLLPEHSLDNVTQGGRNRVRILREE